MTTVAHDAEKFHELDLDTYQAWREYSGRLAGLEGEEYERVESEAWADLQRELRRLERKRELLAGPAV